MKPTFYTYDGPDNFSFTLNNHQYLMVGGRLEIDGVEFEEDPEGINEAYDMARFIASLATIITSLREVTNG